MYLGAILCVTWGKFIIYDLMFPNDMVVLYNLTLFTNFISDVLTNHTQVDAIYSDYSRAFDSLNNSLLIYLNHYHMSNIKWRLKTSVPIHCIHLPVLPKSLHIGPALFIFFINDVTSYLKFSKVFEFSDSVKIFNSILSSSDSGNLQRDIDTFIEWSRVNGLILNLNKWNIVSFNNLETHF